VPLLGDCHRLEHLVRAHVSPIPLLRLPPTILLLVGLHDVEAGGPLHDKCFIRLVTGGGRVGLAQVLGLAEEIRAFFFRSLAERHVVVLGELIGLVGGSTGAGLGNLLDLIGEGLPLGILPKLPVLGLPGDRLVVQAGCWQGLSSFLRLRQEIRQLVFGDGVLGVSWGDAVHGEPVAIDTKLLLAG